MNTINNFEHILCITNNKGGVGKTTIALNLGYILSLTKKVLLVDLDPQANLTKSFDINNKDIFIADVLLSRNCINDSIINVKKNLDIVPSHLSLKNAIKGIETILDSGNLLRNKLSQLKHHYDVIIIDNSPWLGILKKISLQASNAVLIPILPESYSIIGLSGLFSLFSEIQPNKRPKILGLVVNQYDGRVRLHNEILQELRKNSKFKILFSKIRKNSWLATAQFQFLPLNEKNNRKAWQDFSELQHEIMERSETF